MLLSCYLSLINISLLFLFGRVFILLFLTSLIIFIFFLLLILMDSFYRPHSPQYPFNFFLDRLIPLILILTPVCFLTIDYLFLRSFDYSLFFAHIGVTTPLIYLLRFSMDYLLGSESLIILHYICLIDTVSYKRKHSVSPQFLYLY